MFNRKSKSFLHVLVLTALLLLVACSGKKMTKVTQPPTPAPTLPAPTATLSAKPDSIEQGQSTVLTWQTTNATDITIEGLGVVSPSGSRSLTLPASKTFTLTAKGAGGTSQASVRVTVNPAHAAVTEPSDADLFGRNVKDVYFNFDDSMLRGDAVVVAENDGSFLSQHSNVKVLIEGHCDDRGSEIYNLALGERRANTVREALIKQGVDPSNIKTVSYGKERPFCDQENEQCWQQNRRDHFMLQR